MRIRWLFHMIDGYYKRGAFAGKSSLRKQDGLQPFPAPLEAHQFGVLFVIEHFDIFISPGKKGFRIPFP